MNVTFFTTEGKQPSKDKFQQGSFTLLKIDSKIHESKRKIREMLLCCDSEPRVLQVESARHGDVFLPGVFEKKVST